MYWSCQRLLFTHCMGDDWNLVYKNHVEESIWYSPVNLSQMYRLITVRFKAEECDVCPSIHSNDASRSRWKGRVWFFRMLWIESRKLKSRSCRGMLTLISALEMNLWLVERYFHIYRQSTSLKITCAEKISSELLKVDVNLTDSLKSNLFRNNQIWLHYDAFLILKYFG